MQLTVQPRRSGSWRLRWLLAAAASVVLGLTAYPARADKDANEDAPAVSEKEVPTPPIARDSSRPADTSGKRISFEMSTYEDSDHVTVVTPSLNATIDNVTQGASISGHYLVDVVSAASADIVSTASERWREVRQAGGIEATYKPHETGATLAASTSIESDYVALTFGGVLTHEFNEKNSTLLLGYGYSHDTIGYHFTPHSAFSRILDSQKVSLGLTQVMNRSTVGSIALDGDFENGDSSKAYRYIPIFSSSSAAALLQNGAPIPQVFNAMQSTAGNTHPGFRVAEQLPVTRQRYSISGRIAHRFDGSTLRLEQRFYDDSWLLFASTTDMRWIFDIGRRFELWPHFRLHGQKAVNFWQRTYVDTTPGNSFAIPEYRTGNRELGPLLAETAGGGVKLFLGSAGNPKSFAIGLHADYVHTNYLNDLYVSSRDGFIGAMIVDGEL